MKVDRLTFNTKHLISALVVAGVKNFVISPGSRSTPIALLIAEYAQYDPAICYWIDVDERSAAFFALGLAKGLQQPVVLLATSGTAVLEYLPAVAEAQVSEIPLILLTANRPQELQDLGAAQTIPQIEPFTVYAKKQLSLVLQDDEPDVTEYIDFKVQALVHEAGRAPAGPVQIDLPLRKPLLPAMGEEPIDPVQPLAYAAMGKRTLDKSQSLTGYQRIMILAGPNVTADYQDQLWRFAQEYSIPVWTDILSRVRTPKSLYGLNDWLTDDKLGSQYFPDLVLRFGKTPISPSLLAWLKQKAIPIWQIGTPADLDYTRQSQRCFEMVPSEFLNSVACVQSDEQQDFNARWQALSPNKGTSRASDLISCLDQIVNPEQAIFVANSLSIRQMDTYFSGKNSHKIYANRGVNGIDGVISSALGLSASQKQHRSILLTGDLSFFHDMNGLMMAKKYQLPLDIIVMNNNGGGIFAGLPQAQCNQYFTELFATPLNLDFQSIAQVYDLPYTALQNLAQLPQLLNRSVTAGPQLILYESDAY
ncbi:2-succinyl-5-enolpyruvyl-6-hydroxy-3-cyclohexene-1-carboxylic-acid synthase [Convivina praedatoris]|uniref:2-succinyl-5-enolpyruvyl-6-hydroxy-3-cyclohexene-1-carboxylate synthase n=1 Tax=Convivina praedatoris TaxID=2880963 RepID=A0ABN8HD00_9LACO|nr:2-succinyl-5-enolpyruvyl-6-hydroxy-3-cyclohexene-1-carboxylic-acid synthase [Convivina sp. LMG 32447]CAH1852043.1 2-succinyl-5-enolpyruvyl-6-hydroxy-3-cyclohexene-1-carboxylate synthase [Convivina sp. LMG 32447]CAH1853928.1 2-succinyl-5-enolpyruvyl-6-hydroxy-3-cyclohexene-1-carboxylate synthase [Convivina sp. LMG 32447]CAH1854132.1 2-succinyl-5-enolpyruvyl-6-hydroxy-3-cyclohexene-1-carboxylate synthase [Convivina sp. LMG 32447]